MYIFHDLDWWFAGCRLIGGEEFVAHPAEKGEKSHVGCTASLWYLMQQ